MKNPLRAYALFVLFAVLAPNPVRAAVSDWYGTWQATYTGGSAGTCSVTVGAGNASQASVSIGCSSSVGDPGFSGSGSISASGSLNLTGTGTATGSIGGFSVQVVFGGILQGNSGQGQWTMTTVPPSAFTQSGTWTMTRISAPQPDPNRAVAPPPVAQTDFTTTTGRMPTAAVSTVAAGTLGNATVNITLDLSRVLSGGSFAAQGQFAAGYNIYVAALVPGGVLGLPSATWFQLPASGGWGTLTLPIAAYREGLAQSAADRIQITVVQNLDVTALLATEVYIGYGTSDTEMLESGRYRGVYIVR